MATSTVTPTVYQLPIPGGAAPQSFSTVMPDGLTYTIRLIYQFNLDNCWLMDISGGPTANPITIQGIPVITGADLLAQYTYLFANPFSMYASTAGSITTPPYWYNLGTTGNIYVSTPAGA